MVFELIYGKSPSGLVYPFNLALISILLVAVITDLMARTVPNWLIFLGLMSALTISAAMNGFMGLGFMALGFAAGILFFLPIYLTGLLGAGDVKLIGIVGAFLGLHQMLVSAVLIFLVGGLISLFMLGRHRSSRHLPQVPYAVAIAAGVFAHLIIFN